MSRPQAFCTHKRHWLVLLSLLAALGSACSDKKEGGTVTTPDVVTTVDTEELDGSDKPEDVTGDQLGGDTDGVAKTDDAGQTDAADGTDATDAGPDGTDADADAETPDGSDAQLPDSADGEVSGGDADVLPPDADTVIDPDASAVSALCRPCDQNADCAASAGAVCHSLGAENGAFCATTCSAVAPCPGGYTCKVIAEGSGSNYCVPNAPTCACDAAAIADGASTSCSATTSWGSCGGKRSCMADGSLGACDAPAAASETCDGVDNDCDGSTDEGVPVLKTLCGVGACAATGETSCVNGVPVDSCVPEPAAATDTSCNAVDDDCDGSTDEDFTPVASKCGVGSCATVGQLVCLSGQIKDTCKALPPALSDVTCNGTDDDCNGQTDEDYAPQVTSCGVGACVASGTSSCGSGGKVASNCTPLAPASTDDDCDAVDDDCDGQTDEDYAALVTSCGQGACATTGLTSCAGGTVKDSCVALAAAASDTSCDGVDDNCNGQTDEAYQPLPTSCGASVCANTGATACENGEVVDTCKPLTPEGGDANCNSVDDDCDGQTDEEYQPEQTSCGVGACATAGVTSCVDGDVKDSCVALPAAASDSTCDGVDDNCNGQTDEAYQAKATQCGIGGCAAVGFTSCQFGKVKDSCNAGLPAANDASCNSVDNDCDGQTDEDFAIVPTTCGKGACAASGSTQCVNGVASDTCAALPPGPNDASCDNIDNNCNGQTDEGFVSQNTACGIGACKATGYTTCQVGQVKDNCAPFPPEANDAVCDNADNDCDGQTDEEYVPVGTTCGVGACATTGTTACQAGLIKNACTPLTAGDSDADCDSVDDDCNGQTDEDYTPVTTSCGSGDCASWGETYCQNGAVKDNCAPGDPSGSDDNCNGRDDNCNGQTDEDYAPVPTNCGVGACAASGTSSCVGGVVKQNCTAGAPSPSDTSCNQVDDNCNGTTDEGFVQSATACGVGNCVSAGHLKCVSGQVQDTCVAGPPGVAESNCNNQDDDCDGSTDEGFPQSPTICGMGACASNGNAYCESGVVKTTCVAGTPGPSDSSCNNVDDNCDGQTDEGFVVQNTTCGVGSCLRAGQTSCHNGQTLDSCIAGTAQPDDSVCNSQDDDCNGQTDEDYVPLDTQCGTGACVATGKSSCSNGLIADSCAPKAPGADDKSCNGVDDNCDGSTDEGYVSLTTSCGQGACVAAGATSCVSGSVHDNCAPLPAQSADDDCDNIDDNCNNQTDEGYPDLNTYCGIGACARSGKQLCTNGSLVNTCSAGTPGPSDASCDSVDNNCNGQTDEDYGQIPSTCGTGDCATTGVLTCQNGQVNNSCTPLPAQSNDATCDLHDDDCDGSTDEDFVKATTSCGVGVCTGAGQLSCSNGVVSNSCAAGSQSGNDSDCDNLDDNCNGQTDENYAPVPTSCGLGDCANSGLIVCNSGVTSDTCTPFPPAESPEVSCDNVDNDCDGKTDGADSDVDVNVCCLGNAGQPGIDPDRVCPTNWFCDQSWDTLDGKASVYERRCYYFGTGSGSTDGECSPYDCGKAVGQGQVDAQFTTYDWCEIFKDLAVLGIAANHINAACGWATNGVFASNSPRSGNGSQGSPLEFDGGYCSCNPLCEIFTSAGHGCCKNVFATGPSSDVSTYGAFNCGKTHVSSSTLPSFSDPYKTGSRCRHSVECLGFMHCSTPGTWSADGVPVPTPTSQAEGTCTM